MEEDLGVKTPVTRLRRRLSVEAEETVSTPTTPGTPTKKRATRLAAKPQLELIDELVTEDVPKKSTRKAAVKEAVEDEAPEALMTPAPVTPSRRSTRIRSNTSLLAEPILSVDTPRARRALRRNSQLGSDTESSVTPARKTRKTRKDSTTSVDIQAETESGKVMMYVVTTTTEGEPNKADSEKDPKHLKADDKSSQPKRKSPRLNKKGTKTDDSNMDKDVNNEVNTLNENKQTLDTTTQSTMSPNESEKAEDKKDFFSKINDVENDKLSPVVLLDRGIASNKKINAMNKSTSAIETIADNLNNKRNRTKSWTTITSPNANVAFHSDNESEKITTKQMSLKSNIGSGDGSLSIGGNESKPEAKTMPEMVLNQPLNKSKSASLHSLENKENIIVANSQCEVFESLVNKSDTEKLFEKSPGTNMQPLVVIEDSDSCSVEKLSINIQMEGEDQCVPTMLNPSTPTKVNQSVEPMDIDETMPTNVTINDFEKSNTSNEESEVPKHNMNLDLDEKNLSIDENINKSNRKSSVSYQSAVDSERLSIDEEKKIINSNEVHKSKNYSMSIQEKSTTCINEKKNDTPKSIRSSFSFQNAEEKHHIESVKSADKSSRKSSISASEIRFRSETEKIQISAVENNSESPGKFQKKTPMVQSISEIPQNIFDNKNNDSKSPKISKRKSSISDMDSQNLEKSSNENKSTLVISQLKDVSSNDTNKAMSPNVTNNINELSKSMNDPVAKNKDINNENSTLNYLTSTPIQQKALQKLTMQINTSIISPNIGNKNETPKKNCTEVPSDSDSSDNENEKMNVGNKKENIVPPNKKISNVAAFSSDSSDTESEITFKNHNKNAAKQSSIKKTPSSESSDSSDEELMSNNKSNNKKTPKISLNSSKSQRIKAETTREKASRPHSNSESSNDSYEGIMKDLNNMVDDEALEASDDYESGDSRDDEERRYEAENEIVEKGETLDTEEELSNDSEYEKDSFIVSSDAEDNEMLSGTGDDLSDTDNELNMSKKSKKKFNERKHKQQKKASKEMYEARHKINESANNSKSETTKLKKSKRQRLESSNIESDDNDNVQSNKKNRMRIDSSQDISIAKAGADDTLGIKKRKSKRLSESVSEDVNEKEITVCDQSIAEKNDPLSVAIKQELKTPQKHFNMSTVAINDNIEEVQVDSNDSMMGQNDAIDPLQATMIQDEDSSSSNNMEIIQNYDSVLNNLSKQTIRIKTNDISLNSKKKSKDSKDPLIDQLNLTVTQNKKSRNKNKSVDKQPETTVNESLKVSKEEEDTSDSINMKLLFSEDSNDSEIPASQFQPETREPLENIIPLKRTAAQTNIPGNMDLEKSLNESHVDLNVSKKKKNRKSSHCLPDEKTPSKLDINEEPVNAFKIIIDTTGTHEDTDTSTQVKSAKKKKNKNKLINEENESDFVETPEDSHFKFFVDTTGTYEDAGNASATLINSAKKKKKHNVNNDEPTDIVENLEENLDVPRQSLSAKKKKNKESKLDVDENPEESSFLINDTSSQMNSTKNKKNKESRLDVVENPEESRFLINDTSTQINSAKKKKNKESKLDVENPEESSFQVINDTSTQINSTKKKKKQKSNISQTSESAVEIDCTDGAELLEDSVGEKKNKSFNVSVNNIDSSVVESQTEKKKSRKKAASALYDTEADNQNPDIKIIEELSVNVSGKSDKKKKKSKNVSFNIELEREEVENVEMNTKNNFMSSDDTVTPAQNTVSEEMATESIKKKKKKNKKNLDVSVVDNAGDDSDEAPLEMSYKSDKKTDATDSVIDDALTGNSEKKKHKKSKKKKNKNLTQSLTSDTGDISLVNNNRGDKRKRKLEATDSPTATEDAAPVVPKKRKLLDDEYIASYTDSNEGIDQDHEENNTKQSRKKHKKSKLQEIIPHDEVTQHKSKKRKREDNNEELSSKVAKENSYDSVLNVARLPESLLHQLDEKPKNTNANKKRRIAAISTVPFVVEDAQRRKNKPSTYLEHSVYLNDSPYKVKNKKSKQNKPKVLPFTPTALTSDNGYTSLFNINVLPKETQFVAQASNVHNFKASHLGKSQVKKLGTLERCKLQRSHKISKF